MREDGDDRADLGRDPDAPQDEAAVVVPTAGYFVMRFGQALYAFPDRDVAFVAQVTRPARIPTAPDSFLGVVHLRGRVVAVVDLPRVLGLADAPATNSEALLDRRLVVLESRGEGFAVVADSVLGQHQVAVASVRAPESGGPEQPGFTGLAQGQFDHPAGVVTILGAAVLLRGLDPGAADI